MLAQLLDKEINNNVAPQHPSFIRVWICDTYTSLFARRAVQSLGIEPLSATNPLTCTTASCPFTADANFASGPVCCVVPRTPSTGQEEVILSSWHPPGESRATRKEGKCGVFVGRRALPARRGGGLGTGGQPRPKAPEQGVEVVLGQGRCGGVVGAVAGGVLPPGTSPPSPHGTAAGTPSMAQ